MPVKLHPGQVALSCDTIGDQDNGIARHLIDSEITKAVNDLDDRGEEDGKPRKVAIEIEMVSANGLVISTVSAQAKLPARRTRNTAGEMRMAGKGTHLIVFQKHNSDRADQPTFGDAGDVGEQDADE
jgi:hypothetical protein